MTQNSVLSQHWVGFTGCTPKDPGCPRTVPRPCAQCRVVARTGRVAGRVARARCCIVAPSDQDTKIVSRPKPCRAPCRARCSECRRAPVPCRWALLRRITALLLRIATPNGRPQQRYKICIATHPMAKPPPRARAARPCAQADRVLGPCRRVFRCIVAPYRMPLHPVSRYNLLYHDSDWKNGQ